MNKNFYPLIKLLFNATIEKTYPATITARTIFIFPATVSVGLSCILNGIRILDNYEYKYDHLKGVFLVEKDIDLLIIYLSQKALELLNQDMKLKIIEDYLASNSIQINFLENEILRNIINEMVNYYNYRNQDGWKESGVQINLPNKNFIDVNKPLNINDFNKPEVWTPLEGQKIIGAKWGNIKSILPESSLEIINDFSDGFFEKVDLKTESKKILDKSLSLTDKEKVIAEFWAGIPGTSVTGAGYFVMFLYGYFKSNPRPNMMQLDFFYILSAGIFQATISTWVPKYKYLQCRPIQSIRLYHPNIPINYYYGASNSSVWKPYQNSKLLTPPFPDYIAAHSSNSMVAACILTELLGPNIKSLKITLSKDELIMLSPLFISTKYDIMDISKMKFEPGTSAILKNTPSEEVELNFDTWEEMAKSAGISRIYGGIHYPSSDIAGLEIGKMISKLLLNHRYLKFSNNNMDISLKESFNNYDINENIIFYLLVIIFFIVMLNKK